MTSNPLLAPLDSLIDYQALKAEHFEPAVDELIESYRSLLNELSKIENPTWENFSKPREVLSEKLSRASTVAGHLDSVNNTEEIRKAYNAILPKLSAFYSWIGLNEDLYKQEKRIKESPEFKELNPVRQRIINDTIKNYRLGGIELDSEGKARRAEIDAKLSELSQTFSLNNLDATDSWSYVETDENELSGIPQDAIDAAKELAEKNGHEGWEFTLHMPSFLPVIDYADSSKLRERVYRAYSTLASDQGDKKYDNSETIEKILALRQESAKQVDYKNIADVIFEFRMASSPAQVLDFLRDLATKARPFAEQDIAELQAFAKENLGMDELQPWDYGYVSEKLKEHRFNFSEEEIKSYLPQERVFKGLFSLIEKLFSVKFVATDEAQVWDENVQVFRVEEQGKLIGYLYTDLYARNGKQNGAWVNPERPRQWLDSGLVVPVVYLTCNFTKPAQGKPALLRHDDVITLFHEMGHALHGLLTKVDEADLSGLNVEWDAVELPSQFMENFCWEWSVMKELTSHVKTQEPMPKELFDKLHQAKNFQSGSSFLRQIEFSLFDLLIHTDDKKLSIDDVMAILNKVRQEVAVISPPEWNRFPHHFSHIFAGGYAAGYYSYKWAEVLSADAYSYFEENATEEDGTVNPASGKHYKDNILAVGGSIPAEEFFRNFRGRDPKPDALLRHNGMSGSPQSS